MKTRLIHLPKMAIMAAFVFLVLFTAGPPATAGCWDGPRLLWGVSHFATAAAVHPLPGPLAAWQTVQFDLDSNPTANPCDPEAARIDAQITTPSSTVSMPGFWYQDHTRTLEEGRETLTPSGPPGWRIRFLPREPGRHTIRAVFTEQGVEKAVWEGQFDVKPAVTPFTGLVRVEPQQKRYFMLDDAASAPRPFPLIGMNACWHHRGGSDDYETWFAEFQNAGMNYARIWMWPLAFGIEVLPGERLNYNQENAWRLDRTLDLAAQNGVRIMLCLDFHGIFQTEPDVWNANDDWPRHPYNAANGGPCAKQNDFFTNPEARALYQKRLRYLVARYASHPALMSWEFFNEINNVYNVLNPPDVVAWHDLMAKWLKTNDPYNHLVTTSFGGSREYPNMWNLPPLDYIQCHTYLNGIDTKTPPAQNIAATAQTFHDKFNKPVYIGEYGITWKGLMTEWDPYYRGMKQGVWAGIMCGTAGTAMSWWWEGIHEKDLYPIWKSVSNFIQGTGFGSAEWRPLSLPLSDSLAAYAMTDGKTILLWLVDKRYEYPNNATVEAELFSPATDFTIPLPDGPYDITWYDTTAGKTITTQTAASRNSSLTFEIPPFTTDVAAKMQWHQRSAAPVDGKGDSAGCT